MILLKLPKSICTQNKVILCIVPDFQEVGCFLLVELLGATFSKTLNHLKILIKFLDTQLSMNQAYVYDTNSINLCLDTNLQHYAVINDSQIEIHTVS